jgi:hypothetical protein
MTEPTENELLDECPRCGYSLRGLPVEHCCPEWGLTFDRRWTVFGGYSHARKSAREGGVECASTIVILLLCMVIA